MSGIAFQSVESNGWGFNLTTASESGPVLSATNLAILGLWTASAGSDDGVAATFGGVSMDEITRKRSTTNETAVAWILSGALVPVSGAETFQVTWDNSRNSGLVGFYVLEFVHRSDPIVDSDTLAATTDSPTLTLTTQEKGFCIDLLVKSAVGTETPDAPQTLRMSEEPGGAGYSSSRTPAAGVSTDMEWSNSNSVALAYLALSLRYGPAARRISTLF